MAGRQRLSRRRVVAGLLAAIALAMCSMWLLRSPGERAKVDSRSAGDLQHLPEGFAETASDAASRFTIMITATTSDLDPESPAGRAAIKVVGEDEAGIVAEAALSDLLPPLRLGGVLSAPRVVTFSGQSCSLELTSVVAEGGSRSLTMDVLAEIVGEDRVSLDAHMKFVEMRGPVDEVAERAGLLLAPRGAQRFQGALEAGQSVFMRERVGRSEFLTLLQWELAPLPDGRAGPGGGQ